ncbi:hypothetical protein CLAFUW4_11976 [Fulvia fulva]|nr:uncharacterized protein CLAFUR5_20325 [Fulvia fulva]KAK4617892.1 hypothetical protein CLAFUR4_11981 [Fulvia fulva]KAK4618613.1 hypothetical protein CLAFUR0_11992 [Fulvia fulva]WMI38974.1 hypothetical protein CLAFUR5_20325 [Fulvia fulva]WPV18059.1 hypothetical protein CLAFUW4_11976 [Fulvia fulva]WPV33314.1 hypothetical protein CLAFUW7_11983 [Fulvia fulva]
MEQPHRAVGNNKLLNLFWPEASVMPTHLRLQVIQ